MTFDRESGVYEALRKDLRKFTPLPVREPRRRGEAVTTVSNQSGTGGAPTYVIAASNASSDSLNKADIIAGGSSDESTVQTVVTDLASTGGRILLTEGDFTFSGQVTMEAGVHIYGMGWDTVITMAASSNYDYVFSFNEKSNLFFSDFVVDGNKANQSSGLGRLLGGLGGVGPDSEETVMRFLWLKNGYGIGVFADAATDNWEIGSCIITGCNSHGMNLSGSNHYIHGNIITSNGGSGYESTDGSQENIRFVNNVVGNNSQEGFTSRGSHSVIANNRAHNNGNNGLELSGTSGTCRYWTVVGNTVTSNTGYGLRLGNGSDGDSDYNVVTGNVFSGNGSGSLRAGTSTTVIGYNYGLSAGQQTATTDDDAIHDNVAAEISAVTLKSTLVGADELLVEDSADSYNKKSATIASITQSTADFSDGRATLTTGTGNQKWVAPFDLTIKDVQLAVGTSPTGADLIVDVNKNGTTIFTTQANRPTVPDGDADGIGSAATPDVTAMTAGDYLTVDIDQVGSTVEGGYLTVVVEWSL